MQKSFSCLSQNFLSKNLLSVGIVHYIPEDFFLHSHQEIFHYPDNMQQPKLFSFSNIFLKTDFFSKFWANKNNFRSVLGFSLTVEIMSLNLSEISLINIIFLLNKDVYKYVHLKFSHFL